MGNYGKKVFFMGFIEQERHIDLLACAIFVKIRRKNGSNCYSETLNHNM